MKHSVSVTCCALLVSSISLSYAAEVPSGTVLAEKQELVRHIKPRFYVSTSKSIIKALINMHSFEIQLSPIG